MHKGGKRTSAICRMRIYDIRTDYSHTIIEYCYEILSVFRNNLKSQYTYPYLEGDRRKNWKQAQSICSQIEMCVFFVVLTFFKNPSIAVPTLHRTRLARAANL